MLGLTFVKSTNNSDRNRALQEIAERHRQEMANQAQWEADARAERERIQQERDHTRIRSSMSNNTPSNSYSTRGWIKSIFNLKVICFLLIK